jgi:hypothetical protein
MWIIPSSHPLYSAFAQECVASKEELKEISGPLDQSLMWKSSRLSLKTWSGKWKRVFWLQHLFGRMLKPSHQNSFTEKYTASLADIHVSPSVTQDLEEELKTQDISGPTFSGSLLQLDLFGVSSKTSPDISPSDLEKLDLNFRAWVTKLKREYSQRKKQALRIRENASSSSQWKTPQMSDGEGGVMYEKTGDGHFKLRDQIHWTTPVATDSNRETKYQQGGTALSLQVKENWPTPTTMENEQDPEKFKARAKRLKERNNGKNGTKRSGNGAGTNLATKVQEELNWPTPNTMDSLPPKSEQALKNEQEFRPGRQMVSNLRDAVINPPWPTPRARDHMGMTQRGLHKPEDALPNMVQSTDGQLHQDSLSTRGSRHVLNPAWVMCLMGTTLEKTFFAWQEMELSNKQRK